VKLRRRTVEFAEILRGPRMHGKYLSTRLFRIRGAQSRLTLQ
jgi:hypothetical protein